MPAIDDQLNSRHVGLIFVRQHTSNSFAQSIVLPSPSVEEKEIREATNEFVEMLTNATCQNDSRNQSLAL
jgi:hypothetical protein